MKTTPLIILCSALLALSTANAALMGTAFTYQGRLNDGTNPASGRYDFTFTLYDDPASAKIIAGPLTNSRVNVVDGFFTVALDFRGNAFGGEARWLAIAVRSSGGLAFTPLSPRQLLTPTPQALFASDAGDALRLDGQLATAYAPATGSTSYVAKAGDTMTGPLVVPANGLRAGADQLVLTGGDVGIGTTTPLSRLDVVDAAGTMPTLVRMESSRTSGSWLGLANTDTGGRRWNFISTGSGNTGGAGNLLFRESVAGGSALTLTPAGRVGVGTLGPISKFDVVDETGTSPTLIRAESPRTAGSWLSLVNTDTGGKQWDLISTGSGSTGGAGRLVLRQDAVGHVMTLTPEGRVGLGTDSPAGKLDVATGPGDNTILIHARGSSPSGTHLALDNSDTGGKSWYLNSSGSGNSGGPGKLMVNQGSSPPLLVLDSNQRAGINNTEPLAALDVVTSGSGTAIHAKDSAGSGEAWLGTADTSNPPNSYGVMAQAEHRGGYFTATADGTYVLLADRTASTYGNGVKNFLQNHPYEKDKIIVYTCLEGDEVGTYTRGSDRLVNGEARIVLGETFKWVTNPDIGLTAHLTPHAQAVPLAVVSLTTEELVVRGAEGGPDVAFDYIVNGLRIGFEEAAVVRPKEREAWIPSMATQEETYAKQPELRKFNALERFETMRPAAQSKSVALNLSRANALRDAITVYDPAIRHVPHPPRPEQSAAATQSPEPATTANDATPSTSQATGSRNDEVQELRARVDVLEKLLAQLIVAHNSR